MKKILIIEDNIYLQNVLKSVIEESGYNPLVAVDKESGLKKFNSNNPDLILLDKKLPDGDGFDLLKKFKELRSYLPVIILTAQSGSGVKKEALDLGANAFISKPFNNSELLTVIEKLLV